MLLKKVASFVGVNFFISISGFRLKFSRIAFLRKRFQFDSKSDLTTNGIILEFIVGIWLFFLTSYLQGLKYVHKLFKCDFLLPTSNLFDD